MENQEPESLDQALNRIALEIEPFPSKKESQSRNRRASDVFPDFKSQFEKYIASNTFTNEQYAVLLSNAVRIKSRTHVSQKQQIQQMIQSLQKNIQPIQVQ